MTKLLVGFDSAWTADNTGAVIGILRTADGTLQEIEDPQSVNYDGAERLILAWENQYKPTATIVLLDQPTIETETGTDPVSLQYQGGAYTATRALATAGREGLLTAGTLGASSAVQAGRWGGRGAMMGLNAIDAATGGYDAYRGIQQARCGDWAGGLTRAGLGLAGAIGGGGRLGNEALDTFRRGPEFGGRNFRVAPVGNRRGHSSGRFPHYHRSRKNSDGSIKYGQNRNGDGPRFVGPFRWPGP